MSRPRTRFWSSKKRPAEERFWGLVNKDGPTPGHMPHLGPCWVWIGGTNGHGYGTFGELWNRPGYAHRYSWKIHRCDPGEFQVCHHCDNKGCVNPAHLFLGTAKDNMQDMWRKGRGPERDLRGDANPRAILPGKDIARIRARYAAGGVTQQELADEYGLSRTALGACLRGRSWGAADGVPPSGFYRRGSATKNAKLTEELVRGILVTCGSCRAVAESFGVTPGLISMIRLRKIWRHAA